MNIWPGRRRQALTQEHLNQWNADNYPGTRQRCEPCWERMGGES